MLLAFVHIWTKCVGGLDATNCMCMRPCMCVGTISGFRRKIWNGCK